MRSLKFGFLGTGLARRSGQKGNGERRRPAKHILPTAFLCDSAALRETIPSGPGCGQIAPPLFARITRSLSSASACPSVPVHECPCQLIPPIKRAAKSPQMIYNKLFITYSGSNQVAPSQSESNQSHRLDQPPKVQLNRTASRSVAVINSLEGHTATGFSLRPRFALLPVREQTNPPKVAKGAKSR
jgi:hypothetical protein